MAHLDEGTGSSFTESSQNSYSCTLYNMQESDWKTGKFGTALFFDGVNNEYIECGDILDFEKTDTFTLESWIKTNETDTAILWNKIPLSNENGYSGFINNGKINFNIRTDASNYIRKNSVVAVNDDVWHHVAVTYDGSSTAAGIKIYIDGVLDSSASVQETGTLTTTTNSDPFKIGIRSTSVLEWDGYIDEVVVYDYVKKSFDIINQILDAHVQNITWFVQEPDITFNKPTVLRYNKSSFNMSIVTTLTHFSVPESGWNCTLKYINTTDSLVYFFVSDTTNSTGQAHYYITDDNFNIATDGKLKLECANADQKYGSNELLDVDITSHVITEDAPSSTEVSTTFQININVKDEAEVTNINNVEVDCKLVNENDVVIDSDPSTTNESGNTLCELTTGIGSGTHYIIIGTYDTDGVGTSINNSITVSPSGGGSGGGGGGTSEKKEEPEGDLKVVLLPSGDFSAIVSTLPTNATVEITAKNVGEDTTYIAYIEYPNGVIYKKYPKFTLAKGQTKLYSINFNFTKLSDIKKGKFYLTSTKGVIEKRIIFQASPVLPFAFDIAKLLKTSVENANILLAGLGIFGLLNVFRRKNFA